ncbi:hypothetical protein WJX82_000230 [Trebouxia sp. C0006]
MVIRLYTVPICWTSSSANTTLPLLTTRTWCGHTPCVAITDHRAVTASSLCATALEVFTTRIREKHFSLSGNVRFKPDCKQSRTRETTSMAIWIPDK